MACARSGAGGVGGGCCSSTAGKALELTYSDVDEEDHKPRHECGVFGALLVASPTGTKQEKSASRTTFFALYALNHREILSARARAHAHGVGVKRRHAETAAASLLSRAVLRSQLPSSSLCAPVLPACRWPGIGGHSQL